MPFYLVTHTALVEADDEKGAAEKVVGDLRAGAPVTVSVRSDEATVRQVTVAAGLAPGVDCPNKTDGNDEAQRNTASDQVTVSDVRNPVQDVGPSSSPSLGKTLSISAFALVTILVVRFLAGNSVTS